MSANATYQFGSLLDSGALNESQRELVNGGDANSSLGCDSSDCNCDPCNCDESDCTCNCNG